MKEDKKKICPMCKESSSSKNFDVKLHMAVSHPYVQLEGKHLAINEAIDKALTAPFPQIAIHHLINRLFQNYEPDPKDSTKLRPKSPPHIESV